MWRLPGCSPEELLVARRLAVRTHPVHHKLHSTGMIYNGRQLRDLYIKLYLLYLRISIRKDQTVLKASTYMSKSKNPSLHSKRVGFHIM